MLKNIFTFLLAFIIFHPAGYAQQSPDDYNRSWKTVDSLIQSKGLPKSALTAVKKIYEKAKSGHNEQQLIKSLLYTANLQSGSEEDISGSISSLDTEALAVSPAAAAIIRSIQAQLFWNYLEQHRWQYYNRTTLNEYAAADIKTWTIANFQQKISSLFLASLRPTTVLKQTPAESFQAIIIGGNARYLRPSLYDLLAFRALRYFANDEQDIARPAYAFTLSNPLVFASRDIFTKSVFTTPDSLSLHFKALLIFQDLLKFHASDKSPDALIDADIQRIVFVNRYAVMNNKESLYLAALKQIGHPYPTLPSAAQAWYLEAAFYAQQAERYDPLADTANRYAYLPAKAICENIVLQRDASEGKSNCLDLLKQINARKLDLQAEQVNLPEQPLRALVSYKNIQHLSGRIIRIDAATRESLNSINQQPAFWKRLLDMPVLSTFGQALPATNDFQQHRVEIKIDALPAGEYALLTASDPLFPDSATMAVQFLFISRIAFVNNGTDYFVVGRDGGQPLPGITVRSWYRFYDSKKSAYAYRKAEQYSTDENGYFRLALLKNNYENIKLEFSGRNDRLSADAQNYYSYNNDPTDDAMITTAKGYESRFLKLFLFTDRAIYRPGQTVYWKGIAVTKDFNTKKYKIVSGLHTMISLLNANGIKADSINVTSNDFGSFHGSFKIPQNQLTGEFSIQDDSTENRQSFSVEEYKRPRFFAEYDPLRGSYRVGDSLSVSGTAKGYAGNRIDGALVKYRVVRKSRFPYPWLFRKMPSMSEQEISHGETRTDGNGKFLIPFVAIADPSVSIQSQPVFEYSIISDITDINGETRSAETRVTASYQALNLFIRVPADEKIAADSLQNIAVVSQNISGEFEPVKATIAIYRLQPPQRLIRQRYWSEPDQFVMTNEEYIQNFPHDEYSNETNKDHWARINKTVDKTDRTDTTGKLLTRKDYGNPQAGWYLVEATAKDKYGNLIKDKKYIQVEGQKENTYMSLQYNLVNEEIKTAEPGATVSIHSGTAADHVFLIRTIDKTDEDSVRAYSFLSFNDEIKTTAFPISEMQRGGIGIYDLFVKDNRVYTSTHIINVPWSNKELHISYETYRDKTLPGSGEQWKVNISGYGKDKAAAELLTAMYDASLDAFRKQSWDLPALFPVYSNRIQWNSYNNFNSILSSQRYINETETTQYRLHYDRMLDEGSPSNAFKDVMVRGYGTVRKLAGFGNSIQAMAKSSAPAGENDKLEEDRRAADSVVVQTDNPAQAPGAVQVRKNFNETAFFLPDLKTDSSGNISFAFAMPDALTTWKWMLLAHNKQLAFGYSEKNIITQKELMLIPNMPRFLRAGDSLALPVKISNLSKDSLHGTVNLQWIDPATNARVNAGFQNSSLTQAFSAAAGQSTVILFPVIIADNYQKPVLYRLTAKTEGKAAALSDGEESLLPVLSNRMLITESLPMHSNGNETKTYHFDKLLESSKSKTLTSQALTAEYTSNPAWYAVESLPYLMEFPHECAEQTFNRFYSNSLASRIVNSSAAIKEIFLQWEHADTAALLSNLQKNEELKAVLLRETPWVLNAASESQQKKNIALLFDMVRMGSAQQSAIDKLSQMQCENGGFPWFKSGRADQYITQYILSGIGHLKALRALPEAHAEVINKMSSRAIRFLDKQIKYEYNHRAKSDMISATQIQYLYMRSFFSNEAVPGDVFPALHYYRSQAIINWPKQNMYLRGMIALFLYRTGDIRTAKDILASLRENAIVSEDQGMYWKQVPNGYYWQEAPVETQSLLIEAFQEIGKDPKLCDAMRYWLLQQKRTTQWTSTKATAEACYALLLQGTDWLSAQPSVNIQLGDSSIDSRAEKTEAGSGYLKLSIPGSSVTASMGNIHLLVTTAAGKNNVPGWGAVYWQYFDNIDKISAAKTPLSISKALYVEKNTDHGPVLEPITENQPIHIGDKLKVRLIIKTDRDMEYIHLKDMRASCLEPVNVLSGYQWQDALGYYQATNDESTNFFFDHLPQGTYVFEYSLFVNASGRFSNGISTIGCMYAPEFSAHTGGTRIFVSENN